MSWGLVAVGVGTVVGGAISADASRDAADSQSDAANRASQLQNDQLSRTRADTAQARQAGNFALNQLVGGLGGNLSSSVAADKSVDNFDAQAYLQANPDVAAAGVNPWRHYTEFGQGEGREFKFTPKALAQQNQQSAPSGTTGVSGDFNRDFTLADFEKDPGYDFRLNQGLDSVQGSRAARGSMLSGSTLKALSDYGSDYASSEYGKAYDRFNNDRTQRFNRLATVAGIGQTATNNVGTLGAATAAQVGSNMIGAGNAQAAGQIGQANAVNGTIGNLQSLYQLRQMNKPTNPAPGGNANGYYSPGVGGNSAGGSPDGYW